MTALGSDIPVPSMTALGSNIPVPSMTALGSDIPVPVGGVAKLFIDTDHAVKQRMRRRRRAREMRSKEMARETATEKADMTLA